MNFIQSFVYHFLCNAVLPTVSVTTQQNIETFSDKPLTPLWLWRSDTSNWEWIMHYRALRHKNLLFHTFLRFSLHELHSLNWISKTVKSRKAFSWNCVAWHLLKLSRNPQERLCSYVYKYVICHMSKVNYKHLFVEDQGKLARKSSLNCN